MFDQSNMPMASSEVRMRSAAGRSINIPSYLGVRIARDKSEGRFKDLYSVTLSRGDRRQTVVACADIFMQKYCTSRLFVLFLVKTTICSFGPSFDWSDALFRAWQNLWW